MDPDYRRWRPSRLTCPLAPDAPHLIVPGGFEHALCFLIDSGEVDLPALEARLGNDHGGAPAYHPGVLLKFVLLAYSCGMNRFTLRGRRKVDAQWKLFCLVHNIEKLTHHGYAQ